MSSSPGLEIARRCFDNYRRLKSGREHSIQGFAFEVVHHREIVLTMRSNVYIAALQILQPHPGYGAHETIPIPSSRNHLPVVHLIFGLEEPYFECATAHGGNLSRYDLARLVHALLSQHLRGLLLGK